MRDEGAAVHMADAWARLTGEAGIALLTGGPGHANGVGALYTALASESPVVLLSGHAPLNELGCGSFQEMRQADLAAPVVKASWTAASAETLGADIAKACRIARSGRPGPVHLSLPFDVLEAKVAEGERALAKQADFAPEINELDVKSVDAVQTLLKAAARPRMLLGQVMLFDLVRRSEADMLKYKNFGRKSLREISEILEGMGLHFGMDVTAYMQEAEDKITVVEG